MKDKCILVTGSSKGIGLSVTKKLLALGAKVIGIARDHETLKIENKNYIKYISDVNDLISNAGYGEFGSLDNFSTEQINNFITTNLTSHLLLSKFLLSHFKKIKIGDIIFIGSEAGLLGAKNGSLYCTAKFGLRGLSQSLRKDVAGNNIRVSIINPGMIKTSFFDKLKFAPGDKVENSISLDDVANTTVNILSLDRNTVIDEINISPATKLINFN